MGTGSGDVALLGTGGRYVAGRVPRIQDLDGALTAALVPELQDLRGTLDIPSGGTNATTASGARTELGLGSVATRDTGTVSGRVALLGAMGLFDARIEFPTWKT